MGPTTFWPLFGLVVRTPRLELRLLREEEFADLVGLIDAGIHDPGTMPFFFPWTDVEPRQRAREAAQWMWRHRANWSPDNWTLTCGAFVGGEPVGVQDLGAEHFRAVRSVASSPSNKITPSSATSSPAIIRSSVVFPLPDGPSNATISPG